MTLAIVQARLGSTRLPGKMLRPLAGRPALEHTLERVRAAQSIDRLVVATTTLAMDDPLVRLAERLGVEVFRGHPDDVLDRYYQAAKAFDASPDETIVRLTGDCPMHDPAVIDRVIREFQRAHQEGTRPAEYASNISPPTFPSGLDVEAFSFSALEAAWREATRDFEREHVTTYLRDHPERFPPLNVSCPDGDLSGLRWTLDVEEDAAVLDSLLSLGAAQEAAEFSYRRGLRVVEEHASLASINADVGRNTAVVEAILRDALRESIRRPQAKSREICHRAEELLAAPLASAPFAWTGQIVARASGCRVWDADGNEHIDFQMGNGMAAFGHGISPSERAGAHPVAGIAGQVELASRLLQRFPLPRRAAFYSSLGDALAEAVSGAVRKTGRRRILIAGAPLFEEEVREDNGPERGRLDVKDLELSSQCFDAGDIALGPVAESAAVVVEPIAEYACIAEVSQAMAELCGEMGTLLIVNATPSLLGGCRLDFRDPPPGLDTAVVIGSGLANGQPFGALLGAERLFAGRPRARSAVANLTDRLSIAAALENLIRLDDATERERVCARAAKLWHGLEAVASDFRLFDYCALDYRPPHVVFRFHDSGLLRGTSLQFLFEDLMLSRGLIWGPILTVTPAHKDADVERAIDAARASGRVLRTLIDNRAVERVFDAERKRLGREVHIAETAESSPIWPQYQEPGVAGIPA